jgi:hypothetical protein
MSVKRGLFWERGAPDGMKDKRGGCCEGEYDRSVLYVYMKID